MFTLFWMNKWQSFCILLWMLRRGVYGGRWYGAYVLRVLREVSREIHLWKQNRKYFEALLHHLFCMVAKALNPRLRNIICIGVCEHFWMRWFDTLKNYNKLTICTLAICVFTICASSMGNFQNQWFHWCHHQHPAPLMQRAISNKPTVTFCIHKDAMSLYNIFFHIISSK